MYLDENGNEITVYLDENGNEITTSPSESPSEMRARAKAEFASDWLAQKKAEAESIRETPFGKVASALFPRSVENEILQRPQGHPDSEVFQLAYDAAKDLTSFPGRAMTAGFKKYIRDIGKDYGISPDSSKTWTGDMSKLENQNILEKLATDPLLIPSLGIGTLPTMGVRIGAGTILPLSDVAIEKAKIDQTPSGWDIGLALAAGIIPEGMGKIIKPRALATEMTEPAEEGIRRFLADPLPAGQPKLTDGLPIKYNGKSPAFKQFQEGYDDVDEALSQGIITRELAEQAYPTFPKRPLESRISDKIDQAPRIVKAGVRIVPGVTQAEALLRGVGSAKSLAKIPMSEQLTRAIITSYASGDITPTERNAYLRAVETGDERLIREYKEKYNR